MTSTIALYQIYKQHPIISTDSRVTPPNSLFFALKGPRFNGNAYAEAAINKGAAYAIIDEPAYKKNNQYVLVNDTLTTLQNLARHHRQQFDIPIIAITGSNGKTTTKELTTAVLQTHYITHSTQGNLNNHIGLPLTLLSMPPKTKIAVLEMGAKHIGEIKTLCQIALPTHGLITNIGKAHLEGFGSLEGVKKAKSELYQHLAEHKGVAFIKMGEPHLQALSKQITHQIPYTQSGSPSLAHKGYYEIQLLQEQPYIKAAFLSPIGETIEAQSQLVGLYNLSNIMAAVAIGKYFKVPAQKIKKAIGNYLPTNNRSQILQKNTNTILLDAYNANPTSMRQALSTLCTLPAPQKIAILGDMLELGPRSTAEHHELIQHAQQMPLHETLLLGIEFKKALSQTHQASHPVHHFDTFNELQAYYQQKNYQHSAVLIKGSRGMQLERLVN